MFQRYEEGPEENQHPTGQVKGRGWGKNQVKVTGNSCEFNAQTIRKNTRRG